MFLWRYMELDKFKSLFEKQALFFAFPSCFKNYEEGAFPIGIESIVAKKIKYSIPYNIDMNIDNNKQAMEEYVSSFLMKNKKIINECVISCWHINEDFDKKMWENYAKRNGVAIKVYFENLKKALDDQEYYYIDQKINYINKNVFEYRFKDIFDCLFTIDLGNGVEDENEYRFIIPLTKTIEETKIDNNEDITFLNSPLSKRNIYKIKMLRNSKNNNGVYVPITLSTLEMEIYTTAKMKSIVHEIVPQYEIKDIIYFGERGYGIAAD